ncbi:type III secretion protein HrpT [Pantoea stewartii]|uniref:HrpT family type III secretion system protein n=1 Tax=Pantoea stewartii TaxID=66269 RepID=UPI0021D4E3A6|nr:HrpT family type III secretion system protein [Pantoea stewartii]MCU7369220.1 type III secretion protein HrpT [Pantoea stewartii]
MVPRYIVALLAAMLLASCAPKTSLGCASVECRPQSGDYSLTIWWQPELRNGPTDYTRVQVNP